MGTPIVQISNLQDTSVLFTALESPIWRAKLWITHYEQNLPFMIDNDVTYNYFAVDIESLIINYIKYERLNDPALLRQTHRSWMLDPNDPSVIYVHFENHNPPSKFMSFKSGLTLNFSMGKSVLLGKTKTYPLLLDFPDVEDSSDHLKYQKMKFSSGTIRIDNSTGMFDDLIELFGNDATLLNYTENKALEIIRQFYIEKYSIGLSIIELSVKDKRSRLTIKAPNTYYTKDKYRFIEDKYLDKVIQDAYGKCRGVEGICVNRKQVYNPPEYAPLPGNNNFNNWFQFKFARKITKIESVWVDKSDVWIQVFPGLGIPDNNDPASPDKYQYTNPHRIRIIPIDNIGNDLAPVPVDSSNMNNLPNNDGRIEIWWSQALKDNPGFLERRNGNVEKVKMNGVFVNLHTPGDIVKDMMSYYGDLTPTISYFDLEDWNREMIDSKPIGICLDKEENIYNWIEKIQNGSMMGFQLLVNKNLFTARVDNSNRDENFNIMWNEIVNRAELIPELSGEMYATYTKINHSKDYSDNEYLTEIDKSQQLKILDIYKYEKEYENDSYLTNSADAIKKGKLILSNFKKVNPIIKNIALDGLWENIKLFSTGYINFSVQLPRQMKIIQKYMKDRISLGYIRVKIIGLRRDWKQEKIIIDVIQCDKVYIDITGEYPNTIEYEKDYDNKFPSTLIGEFEQIIDGGLMYA